jgi:hypothetical protein
LKELSDDSLFPSETERRTVLEYIRVIIGIDMGWGDIRR